MNQQVFSSFSEIVRSWPGGIPGCARSHKVDYQTAKKWVQRDSIPAAHWHVTIYEAKKLGVKGITRPMLKRLKESKA